MKIRTLDKIKVFLAPRRDNMIAGDSVLQVVVCDGLKRRLASSTSSLLCLGLGACACVVGG